MSNMDNSYFEQIKARILSSDKGTTYITSDFADIADINSINQSLHRLLKAGVIRRVLRGVYEYPEYSDFLNEFIAASPHKIAEALARNYGWVIVPSGDTALNQFGLSTQVPAIWTYVSTGSYKKYTYDKVTITFTHTTSKDLAKYSYKTALLIQALKAIGNGNISDTQIKKLSTRLTASEKTSALAEAQHSTSWVYAAIKKICNGGNTV
jgi:predicted transcriptional regulator of viral defense system